MGFKRDKTYLLEWDDTHELAGLEVRVRACSVGKYLEIIDDVATQDAGVLRSVFARFSELLLSWNLEDAEGKPVPADSAGVMSVDMDLMTELLNAWKLTLTGVSGPKEQPSSDGSQLVELSIPMETLSESRVS